MKPKKTELPGRDLDDVTLGNPAVFSLLSLDQPESVREIKTRSFLPLPHGKFSVLFSLTNILLNSANPIPSELD